MSSKNTALKDRKHPKGMKLSEALAEDAPRLKAMKGLTDKKATLIAAVDDEEIRKELATDSMSPTSEQLARINQFTRSPKSADEVATFKTLSCNDLPDRDDDQFKTVCVKTFAELEQPFSPTGKSFMMDHGRSVTQQVGRIYGTETKRISGVQHLINEVYVPNTEKNAAYLEDVDFGVHWAVSVGVVLGKTECTVCAEPFSSFGWWCVNGHDKGLWYDPKSEETDSWGYPAPCSPEAKGAIKCVRQFDDPVDMYELSQVFLGAQYFAQLDKDPTFKGALKAASANVPIVGLSTEEAKHLELRHEPAEVSEARLKYTFTVAEDGSLNWTDNKGVRWSFDPEEPEEGVMSFGKTTSDKSEEDEDGDSEEQLSEGDGDPSDDEGDESESDSEAGDGGPGSSGDQPAEAEQLEGGEPDEVEDDAEDDDSSEDDDEEKSAMTKDQILAAAKKANLSDSVIDVAKGAKGNGLTALLLAVGEEVSVLRTKNSELEPKASLGDTYVEELRADAIDWYVKAHQSKETEKVSTSNFQKILANAGDDVELIKAHIEEQKKTARALFPKSVSNRRSSFPSDPNEKKGLNLSDGDVVKEIEDEDGTYDERVKRIHG